MKTISTWTSTNVRQSFLDFFAEKQHTIMASAPVVLPADPTLLFVNAGMNPFKDIFLGARESQSPRVANAQKCIRVSGKHNDLEEVGVDTYHHTFFEMLGNWSFGDYYKQEAISWAWELLTEVWQLPKDRLYATVYKDDDEAAKLWEELTDIDPSHIQRFDEKDNFWEMGETGPCGPCSEIHIDITEDGSGASLVNADSPEVIEIWNLVFIQYNRKQDGSLEELPKKHVDTGMGFERICSVLQGKKSNYDSDVFQPMIQYLQQRSGNVYEGDDAIAMRVIADHVRALSFAIGDGVIPSNDGRGYVLRRLLRRAARYGRNLGLKSPFMADVYHVLKKEMGKVYTALATREDEIVRILHAEEESFSRTLDRGIQLFNETLEGLEKGQPFPGEEAFKLYDTYGFPLDLTMLMAGEQGAKVEVSSFDRCMDAQRKRARASRDRSGDDHMSEMVSILVKEGKSSEFDGYEHQELETEILALFQEGTRIAQANPGEEVWVLLKETPFYAESGGQLGDHGEILLEENGFIEVLDTQKPAEGIILHKGVVHTTPASEKQRVTAVVDRVRRQALEQNHSATHIMNYALRQLLSEDVRQAGSMVASDRLRFDFTYPEAISDTTLEAIEALVNERIRRNERIETRQIPLSEVEGSDIIAVFDEKYGDEVRVVDIGGYSKELCGGTHVRLTGDIGSFRIVSESSVAAGVRRIEAVTGADATQRSLDEHRLVKQLSASLSVKPDQLQERLEKMLETQKQLQRSLKEMEQKAVLAQADTFLQKVTPISGVPVLSVQLDTVSSDLLQVLGDTLLQKMEQGVVVLGSINDGKAAFVTAVSSDWVKKGLHAGTLAGSLAKITEGGGGGRPERAKAGGKNGAKLSEAFQAIPELIAAQLD